MDYSLSLPGLMESSCLWEEISKLSQLGFLVILACHLIVGTLKQLRRNTKNLTEEASTERNKSEVKLGFTYRVTVISSLTMLATGVIMLLKQQHGSGSICESRVQVVSVSAIQVVCWVITLIMLHKVRNRKCVEFPWTLRIWWFFSFVLYLVKTGDSLHIVMTNHERVGMSDYAEFIRLAASSCLLIIAILGKTGILFSIPDGITEPLIRKTDQQYRHKKETLYGKATFIQLITFSWENPLFAAGIKKPLEQDDVPDVDIKDSAEFLSSTFEETLKQATEKDGPVKRPSIYKVIFLFVRRKAAINALFAVLSAFASYVGPYLINDFVDFLSDKSSRSIETGYLLALAFLVAKMIETISQRQWIFGARQLGLHLRAALISKIYQKGLILSSKARQSHGSGEIINYMSVDIQRVTDLVWYVNNIWMLPVQITLAVLILHTNLGLGSVAALAATLLVMACNIPLTRFQRKYQSKIMDAKDARMKATSEILRNMKTLKLQAWDNQYLGKLEALRGVEYIWLWKSLRLAALTAFVFWGSPTFISVTTFGACMLMGIKLTAGRVLSALATFRMLQDPIFSLPDLLSAFAQGKVSIDRIAFFLQEDEIQGNSVEFIPDGETEYAIDIENGVFRWSQNSTEPTLSEIQLKAKKGMKVAVCGTVGSGKSSLLSCILGEIEKKSGSVKVSGSKAYVPQSAWILTGNIRDNILFGSPYEKDKYDRTVKACALEKDFELFSNGDLTEIGERGINMSGGQKQRIQIARAVYQDADIYLLDDPFSAVDAHTGTQLFQECLMGILKEKTILYVTHQVEFLPRADLILVMQNGRIAQAGKFEQLLTEKTGFEILVGAHSQALESIFTIDSTSKASQTAAPQDDCESSETMGVNTGLIQAKQKSELNLSQEIREKAGRLTQDEEREKGSIGRDVYWAYLTTVKGGALVPIIILAQSTFQVLQVASNYWMAWASPSTTESEPAVGLQLMLLVYVLLSVGSSLCVLVRSSLVAMVGLDTAQKLFRNMLHSILRSPMAFFDSTPTGRILSRASSDQSVLDLEIATRLGWCAFSVIQLLGTIAVMSQVAWEVFAIFIPVTAICIWYQRYYIPTARELARLSEIQRAPILHHFAESLAGAATIRAFDQEDRFFNANLCLIDNHSRPWFHNMSAMEWLSFRLNILSNFVFAFSLVLLVSLPEGIINPSLAGLAVTYGINLNVQQASVIWNMCNAENKMISVERILQYSKLTSEAPLVIDDCSPPLNWPDNGSIHFKDLQIRYAEHLPSVLKGISCTFPGRKKIGIVGRTGSGKSTLIQALFRTVEPWEGTIIIDGVDIKKIGLHDLRSRLSIIPQDPTLFEGTVRGNLDPLEQYHDKDIWEALDKCQLEDIIRETEGRLDSPVVENGENWSVGQRQLFCLGRALLKKSTILVLDEATASVDSATDGPIQMVINQEFRDRTVVTIAHRIHTVIDSDLVLVLSDGRIAEYDSPAKLLERDDSFFSKLIKEYSMRSEGCNGKAGQ
uniref:ABC-type xenobiotic transporter n=1 Tax=Sedum alfredii TaxID=439688 RepID=A0A856ZAJ8_9MAGN|nr:ABCC transporter [Sedum alfredii]